MDQHGVESVGNLRDVTDHMHVWTVICEGCVNVMGCVDVEGAFCSCATRGSVHPSEWGCDVTEARSKNHYLRL